MLFLFRIGGKPVLLVSSFVLAVLFSACSDSSENELAVFKALDESLINSNMSINKATETVLRELKEKTTDPASGTKANIWFPKALVVQQKSKDVISYLEELKLALKKETGFDETKNLFNEKDKTSVARFFEKMDKGTDLFDSLMKFKKDIFAIDQQFKQAFKNNMSLTSNSFEVLDNARESFTRTFFKNISIAGALAVLSKFQNSIKIYENRVIQFCNNKVGAFIENYTTYSAIVGQSSNYVKGGDEIEITAGVGEFSRSGKPNMTFNGHEVEINEFGTAIYKFKAPIKAGKYIVPVKISYTDQDGREQYITKNVEYTVAKE
jgi:gliding motility-associated protein GldM